VRQLPSSLLTYEPKSARQASVRDGRSLRTRPHFRGPCGSRCRPGPGRRLGSCPLSARSRSRQGCSTVNRAGEVRSLIASLIQLRLPGSPGHSRPCRRSSQTATTHGEHGPTDLESVLAKPMPTIFRLTSAAAYSSKIQQPVRATAALGKHPHTRQAAPSDRKQHRAGSLHSEAQAP
jgi:hypothetical protein